MFTWTYTFFIDIQENKNLWLFIIIMYLLQIFPQQKYLVNCKLQGSEIQKMVAHVICSFLALILNKGNWLFSFWISQWTLTPFNNSNIGLNMFILWVHDTLCLSTGRRHASLNSSHIGQNLIFTSQIVLRSIQSNLWHKLIPN